jgi:hypothetical protein
MYRIQPLGRLPQSHSSLGAEYVREIIHYMTCTVRQYQNVSNFTNTVSSGQNDKVSECHIVLGLWTVLGTHHYVRNLTLCHLVQIVVEPLY